MRLLDPGAGVGSLTAAVIARLATSRIRPRSICVVCYEIDPNLSRGLGRTMRLCRAAARGAGIRFEFDIRTTDYIADRASRSAELFSTDDSAFDWVVMNPPYGKIQNGSEARRHLRGMGIETTNLYSGFLLLAARQLRPGGEIVSINPRSFCNGPYFKPFRTEFLAGVAIREIHVFESRSHAFREDDVLQENVILHGRRTDKRPATAVVSMTASDGSLSRRRLPYHRLVRATDVDSIVHIVTGESADEVSSNMLRLSCTLADLNLEVSTGRVVDFRVREMLRPDRVAGTVPLIYAAHFQDGMVVWPSDQTRKPNAIVVDERTAGLLTDAGFYVLVKRFSAKEERRRIVAAVYDPCQIKAKRVGFENHLNYFHSRGQGFDAGIARGLAAFLNSTTVDQYFRQFSGHTQVNASDLRRIRYPSMQQLQRIARSCPDLADQVQIDRAVGELFNQSGKAVGRRRADTSPRARGLARQS